MKYAPSRTYLTAYKSPVGDLTLASDGENLTGIWFDGQRHDRTTVGADAAKEEALPVFKLTRKWLDIYFSGKNPSFTPPLRVYGSDFRRLVADIMLTISFGKTMTYGEIGREVARRMGRPHMSAQAVGGAVGHNPIGIIIPCHRVIGANGSLTGYAGGLERKIFLLRNEGIGEFL